MKTTCATALLLTSTTAAVSGFVVVPQNSGNVRSTTTHLNGLFDGVKEAFSAPPSSQLDSERETPIDRWMGWSVVSENAPADAAAAAGTTKKIAQEPCVISEWTTDNASEFNLSDRIQVFGSEQI